MGVTACLALPCFAFPPLAGNKLGNLTLLLVSKCTYQLSANLNQSFILHRTELKFEITEVILTFKMGILSEGFDCTYVPITEV